jgi:hypothetical protein
LVREPIAVEQIGNALKHLHVLRKHLSMTALEVALIEGIGELLCRD